MWFVRPKTLPDWSVAEAHLARVDPTMRDIIPRVGPCQLAPLGKFPGNAFLILCQSIFTQQISTAVAAVLFARFRAMFPRKRPRPELVLAMSDEQLRSAGLSRQKMAYIRDLATHFVDGRLPLRNFPQMCDEEIIDALTDVHGIGRWTAEMFLMFVLVRPDVLPVDDLGIRKNMATAYRLQDPTAKDLRTLGEPWRPWRTVASWYIWQMTEG